VKCAEQHTDGQSENTGKRYDDRNDCSLQSLHLSTQPFCDCMRLIAQIFQTGSFIRAIDCGVIVISACVLGGVSLAGGRAAMTGVIVGVLIAFAV